MKALNFWWWRKLIIYSAPSWARLLALPSAFHQIVYLSLLLFVFSSIYLSSNTFHYSIYIIFYNLDFPFGRTKFFFIFPSSSLSYTIWFCLHSFYKISSVFHYSWFQFYPSCFITHNSFILFHYSMSSFPSHSLGALLPSPPVDGEGRPKRLYGMWDLKSYSSPLNHLWYLLPG